MKRFRIMVRIASGLVLISALTMMPTTVLAAEGGTASGEFQVGNSDPSVTSVELWTTGGTPATTNDMTPQVEYNVKVNISDANTLDDLSTVTVRVFYDSDGSYAAGDEAGAADTQTRAILTWTNGGSPWSIDPSASTTWSLVSANCIEPTLTAGSGTFEFHCKPGKVATETTGVARWHIFSEADDGTATANGTDQNKNINWFGEITVNTASVNWGSLAPGTDFGSSSNKTDISVTYIANGAYDEEVAASANWTGASANATLDVSGATTGTNEFSLKADDSTTLASAVLVTASPTYVTIDNSDDTLTSENGDTITTNTIWLRLSSMLAADTYSGTIYFKIADDS